MSANGQDRGPEKQSGPRRPFPGRLATILFGLLVIQSAWLWVSASPELFYVGNVFLHLLGGLLLALVTLRGSVRAVRAARAAGALAASFSFFALVLLAVSIAAAIVLVAVENVRQHWWILVLHIAFAVAGVLATLVALAAYGRRTGSPRARGALRALGAASTLALLVLLVAAWPGRGRVRSGESRIANPPSPPLVMQDEAMGGGSGPFFPSSAQTSTGGRIPSDFFMTSASCERCHADIFGQWEGSAHHFSSFNNQWYRKSIEYMQQVNSIQSSKWCGGCHDHAVLFNGMMDDPVESFMDTQEAHTGIGCNSCHAITGVKGTMGQGGFYVEYPPLHDLATSENALLRWLHDVAVRLDPGPHRQVFLKPFHREQTAEFCSSCHKVHLDVPVNNYRWFRGFNEYDNWQASGVSGQGARSFYYPAEPLDCAGCHMPLVASADKGNREGRIHNHAFPAANTAVPTANLDAAQLTRTIEFLQRNMVTIDIFSVGPAGLSEAAASAAGVASRESPQLATTFAVGEEAAMPIGGRPRAVREPGPIWAPLDTHPVSLPRGEEVRVDVVVRTRGVGHFFPGGTVDAQEVWLELRAVDDRGRTIFWSGVATDGGRGPVDEGAQFYRAQMVDGHGNPITKRNAWATRAVAWVNLIPPGAADVAHFRLSIPPDCGDEVRLEARLNYRKFTHGNTQFSFAGAPAANEPAAPGPGVERVTAHYDDRVFVTAQVPSDLSAEVREIPDLPIVVMSRDEVTLPVADEPLGDSPPVASSTAEDQERWNDYGIGLLRQGDLAGAARAFRHVTEASPTYADGWVNRARVALREGLLEDAQAWLDEALALEPDLAAANYFLGVVHKEQGRYPQALDSFRRAAERYPRDRVVRNAIGRVLFLSREFGAAVEEFQTVLSIDPEDLTAHYNLMLSYKGLGREEDAVREKALYERFKADEDAPPILGPYLRENPEANRMRQPIHEQRSAPAQLIADETAARARDGEPLVVLPGEAESFARRLVQRGERLIAEGRGAERHLGPTEAGVVRPLKRVSGAAVRGMPPGSGE